MSTPTRRPTRNRGGSGLEDPERAEEGLVNDSLGTVNIADSTGTDEDLETGDARTNNFDTHED